MHYSDTFWLKFNDTSPLSGENLTEVEESSPSPLSPDQNASIHLPASLFAQIKNQTDIGVSVGVYETATLFPVSRHSGAVGSSQTQVCSNVVTAIVGQSMNTENLEDPVTITFTLNNKTDVVSQIL